MYVYICVCGVCVCVACQMFHPLNRMSRLYETHKNRWKWNNNNSSSSNHRILLFITFHYGFPFFEFIIFHSLWWLWTFPFRSAPSSPSNRMRFLQIMIRLRKVIRKPDISAEWIEVYRDFHWAITDYSESPRFPLNLFFSSYIFNRLISFPKVIFGLSTFCLSKFLDFEFDRQFRKRLT